MDSKDNFEKEKGDHSDSMNYNTSNTPLDWRFGDVNLANAPTMAPHHGFTQFPDDSGFIDRAARFSCFGGGGGSCYSDMVKLNPFSIPDSMGGLYSRAPQDVVLARSFEETKQGNESDEAEFSGRGGGEGGRDDPSGGLEATGAVTLGKGLNLKKRKRLVVQDMERDQSKGTRDGDTLKDDTANQQNVDQNLNSSIPNKTTGKQLPQASDHSKEDYIHVRARRGQATNSHSLAERVRREKISERMKFLQDIVPGCNKVTGKAVMLDEIINYVQSLQRQVEFLSMKLATVNPRLDFDIEGLLAKDILQSRLGTSSSTLGFPPDVPMNYPLHPSALVPSTLSGIASPSDLLLRTISSHMPSMSGGGFKEPTQLPNSSWEDELHNIVHMSYGGGAPPENQDATDATQ